MNLRPSDWKTDSPLYRRKSEINPRIKREEKPPTVTTARKTLSENRGFVVMTRFGGKVGAAVLTGRYCYSHSENGRMKGYEKVNEW
jgi:hypothetical protein